MVAKRRSKVSVSERKHKKNRNVVWTLFGLVGVLVLVIGYLVLSSFGFFEERDGEYIDIKDECGVVLGNLIHQVRDGGECRLKCVNECGLKDLEISDFVFEGKNNDCNSCECWCE